MPTQIAAQLFTLREHTKTPADIAKTLSRVREIGYEAVQASALGKIDPAELANFLRDNGLTCCATHTSVDTMRNGTDELVANLKSWNCRYTAIGGTNFEEQSAEPWVNFAKDFSDVAKKFEGSGVSVGYHNHSHELVRFDGKTALDILFENFSDKVWMEIDTYWITHGGGDPAAWIEKCAGRIPCVHVKDMGITGDRKQEMRPVGEGNLNWPAILKAGKAAGVEWYIVEQDNCNGQDPFDCLARSFKNLKAMGLS